MFFAIAILTHFSFAFFIPPVLLLFFYPKVLSSKIILLSSLAFLLIPKELLGDLFSYFELSESYANKAEAYLTSEWDVTVNAQILTYLRNMWEKETPHFPATISFSLHSVPIRENPHTIRDFS